MILLGAVGFFAEHGFRAKTRELAERIGVSESLIYRYFDTKQQLVDHVYRRAVLDKWRPGWEKLLRDRDRPLRQRVIDFYSAYLGAIDNGVWVRFAMYASLDGLDLTKHYMSEQVRPVITAIAEEAGVEYGIREKLNLEQVWQMHSTFIYYLTRKHIHRTPVFRGTCEFLSTTVDDFLEGIEQQALRL